MPLPAEREDTMGQKSIREVVTESGFNAEAPISTHTTTNIIPIKNIKAEFKLCLEGQGSYLRIE